jgi:cytochrome c oxidase cbb3-type subunit 3
MRCHDIDGRGEVGRDTLPKIPDFTEAQWQAARTDAELSHSILEGKGKSMPRMKAKLGSVDVKQMVAFVRAFRGGKQVVDDEPEAASAPAQPAGIVNPAGSSPRATAPTPPSPKELSIREGSRLFQRSCVLCHGPDGKGSDARDNLPTIPDFTVRAWQEKRSDPQLVVSILDGRGTGMPAFRDKVARERVRDLVAFIRTFAPGTTQASESTSDDFEIRFQKLVEEFEGLTQQIRALTPASPSRTTPSTDPSPSPSRP